MYNTLTQARRVLALGPPRRLGWLSIGGGGIPRAFARAASSFVGKLTRCHLVILPSGKRGLVLPSNEHPPWASLPLNPRAALSQARAASASSLKYPMEICFFWCGSRMLATHLPPIFGLLRQLTPMYFDGRCDAAAATALCSSWVSMPRALAAFASTSVGKLRRNHMCGPCDAEVRKPAKKASLF